jgi:hypothetical protein
MATYHLLDDDRAGTLPTPRTEAGVIDILNRLCPSILGRNEIGAINDLTDQE